MSELRLPDALDAPADFGKLIAGETE